MKRIDRSVLMVVVILLAAIAPVVFAGAANFVRTQRSAELKREQALVADYARKLEEAQWRQQVPSAVQAQQWQLLASNEVAGTLQVLQSLVDGSGVSLVAAKASPSGSAGRQLFLLTGSGSPEQVCALLAAIERCPRLIVVENGRFAPRPDDAIDFEFGLATYHRGGDQ